MKIRLAQDKDYAEMARLHRGSVRHINSKDYPNDVIAVWSKRTKAERFRSSASKVKRWIAKNTWERINKALPSECSSTVIQIERISEKKDMMMAVNMMNT